MHLISEFTYAGSLHRIYRAERVDDVLPPGLHKHDYEHICVPMSGEVEAFFDDRAPISAKPGDLPLEFAPGRKHGVRALTAGAIFMNISRI